MVGIVEYGTGNLKSVENALKRLNTEYIISSEEGILRECDRIILPGVGDAKWTMQSLRQSGMDAIIKTFTQPVLGICLGMQLLCSYSEESNTECLGIFSNRVTYIGKIAGNTESILKIPHIGWNSITNLKSVLYEGIKENTYVYFVHSYCADINENTISATEYGGEFSSALKKENFIGCQFHPEKSGLAGEQMLKNFLANNTINL